MLNSRIFSIFRAMLKDSESYKNDDARTGHIADDALAKAERHKSALRKVWEDLTALIRLLMAWAKGRYRSAPWRTISFAIAGVLYFLSPIDAIPDFIPVIGYLDDAIVVMLVMKAVRHDVEKFKTWESAAA